MNGDLFAAAALTALLVTGCLAAVVALVGFIKVKQLMSSRRNDYWGRDELDD